MVLFLAASVLHFRKHPLGFNPYFLWPILLFAFMFISLLWSEDSAKSIRGITKSLPFLLLPLPFLLGYSLTKIQRDLLLRCFGLSMVLYAVFYLLKAVVRFWITGDTGVFFYHELVTFDLNAIYVSVFFVQAFFILLQQKRTLFHYTGLILLLALLLLLSSKNVVVTFIILISIYFFRHRNHINWNVKTKLVLAISTLFLVLASMQFAKRYADEISVQWVKYNQPEQVLLNEDGTHNVSLFEAWNNEKFTENDYFTGISLRVYLVRVFTEMLQERDQWYLGTGYNATYHYLKKSVQEKGMYPEYSRYNFHNQYIQIFAELGIIGLVLILILLLSVLKTALQTKDFTTFVFSILMISLFLTESFFHRQRGILFFVIFYCVLSASKGLRPQK